MSLVSEALRKARGEAGHAQKGSGSLTTVVTSGGRSRMVLGLVLGATIALAAAVAGAALVWWMLGTSGGPRARTTAGSSQHSTEAAPSRGPGNAPLEAPGGASEASRPRTVTAHAAGEDHGPHAPPGTGTPPPAPTGQGEQGAVTPGHGVREPGSSDHDHSAAKGPAPARTGESSPGGVRTFVLRAPLGYATLTLDFLVYKPSAPFAGINGSQVVKGSIVDGFVVEEITADSVHLRDARGGVVLRLH